MGSKIALLQSCALLAQVKYILIKKTNAMKTQGFLRFIHFFALCFFKLYYNI